jgi:type II secretory pathway pseudopilin PulG
MFKLKQKHRLGFTMIELMVAMIFIGLAVAALIASTMAFSRANATGINLSTAEFLVEEIRELTTSLPVMDPVFPETKTSGVFGPEGEASVALYDDVDDFDGQTFNPPIDVHCNPLNNFANFSQTITVESVNPSDLTNVQADYSTLLVRVTVQVALNGEEVSTCSWIRSR